MAEDECWKKSKTKALLVEDILSGAIPNTMHWKDVLVLRPEYDASLRRLFASRLKTLRDQINRSKMSADVEEAALAHDRALFPAPTHNYRGEPRWDESQTQFLLKQDVANLVHATLSPKDFRMTRPEYQLYPLKVFREHIYQEVRFVKFCKWRNDTKKKKATAWM
jgi:hypothetical protein